MAGVQWWEGWQLRVLVLVSLGVQWLLLLAVPTRRYAIPRWFRACIWLARRGSDPLAIYALAVVFLRHAVGGGGSWQAPWPSSGALLEVLWAPVLLVHLGGRQLEMTAAAACNVEEDSEVRIRHATVMLSQVAIALYTFLKSWPGSGDGRLTASWVLLFVVGILTLGEKPWRALRRRASIDKLGAASTRPAHAGFIKCWRRTPAPDVLSDGDKVRLLLSDMSLLAASSHLMRLRRRRQGEVEAEDDGVLRPLSPNAAEAFGLIFTTRLLTTPASMAYHLLLLPSLHVAAIALFAASDKQRYDAMDVTTTYVLVILTAAVGLDVLAGAIRWPLHKLMSAAGVPALCETLPQYNLLRSARRRMQRRRPPAGWLLKCRRERDEGMVDGGVAGSVILDVARAASTSGGARGGGLDLATYRSFAADNWILAVELQRRCGPGSTIESSLREPFDESVLVWHVATDLCFRRSGPPPAAGGDHQREVRARAISNYMAHLLRSRPEMLMTGSRRHLLAEAVEDVELIVLAATDAALLATTIQEAGRSSACPLIHDACRLSDELMGLQPEETRWEVMYRVWLGMLCYSAAMCRGCLHARSLDEGGEFLTLVWLVLSLKGTTKNLADKLQMPEP
ncbi:hypothetical protein C2845_PM09G00680 [Panicum miliaceum]|uniref:DUF4220 domain-containing protein n=1 Tax=Panicum miliaceum TaxID=4540 RepID=A0A3L6S1H4_PANMI|nr:hypothetical protein C2845_PM09G00680 [Panicum miliaceum]